MSSASAGKANNKNRLSAIHSSRLRQIKKIHQAYKKIAALKPVFDAVAVILFNGKESTKKCIEIVGRGDVLVMQEMITSEANDLNEYSILTTKNGQTFCGPLLGVAFILSINNNKIDLVKLLITVPNFFNLTATLYSSHQENTRIYSEQAILDLGLLSMNFQSANIEIFKLLIKNCDLAAYSVAWQEVYQSKSKTQEYKLSSGIIGAVLLQKALDINPSVIEILLEAAPEILRLRSPIGMRYLDVIYKNNQLVYLEKASIEVKTKIKNIIYDLVEEKNKQLDNELALDDEDKDKLKKCCDDIYQQTIYKDGSSNIALVIFTNFLASLIDFCVAIAFTGVGHAYMQNMIAALGLPLGIVPAIIAVVVVTSYNAALTAYWLGDITLGTALAAGVASAGSVLPVSIAGEKTMDTLSQKLDRDKALSMSAMVILISITIFSGLLMIKFLSNTYAADSGELLVIILVVAIAISLANGASMPFFYKKMYKYCKKHSQGK